MYHKVHQQLPDWLLTITKKGIEERENTVEKLFINQLIKKLQL